MPHRLRIALQGLSACLIVAVSLAGCGKPAPRPADADISRYIATSQPAYLHVGQVKTQFTTMDTLGGAALPKGSWRVDVDFTLQAGQDLFSPTPDARAQKAAFDRTVAAVEAYRLPRIAAVEQLARQGGLMAQGAESPEPAIAVALVTHKGQELADHVTLLARPDGPSWQFVQLDAQKLSDDEVGAPLDDLRRSSPGLVFVTAGSEEARVAAARAQRFLELLTKAPKP